MKQLTDILNESIFDVDDNDIMNKHSVGELKYTFFPNRKYFNYLKYHYGLTKDDFEGIMYDIRDNTFNVEQQLYQQVKEILINCEWKIDWQNCAFRRIIMNIYYKNKNALVISISNEEKFITPEKFNDYSNPLVWTDRWADIYTSLNNYVLAVFRAIHESNDTQYDKFKKFFR